MKNDKGKGDSYTRIFASVTKNIIEMQDGKLWGKGREEDRKANVTVTKGQREEVCVRDKFFFLLFYLNS